LQKHVFPKLRELCMQHDYRFQAIDLRWGLSKEASLSHETMRICLQEIKRCQKVTPRPNFIVLLGDRYGWQPIPEEIPGEEFIQIKQVIKKNKKEFDKIAKEAAHRDALSLLDDWYREDENALPPVYILQPVDPESKYAKHEIWEEEVQQPLLHILRKAIKEIDLSKDERLKYEASATHQEIEKGALKVEDADEHVFGFFRNITNLDELKKKLPDEKADDFLDTDLEKKFDESAHDKLLATKEALKQKVGNDNIFSYGARWKDNTITMEHLKKLCDDVYDNLSRIIEKQIKALKEQTPLEKEIDAHEDFRKDRAKHFISRVEILDSIKDYIHGTDNHPLAIYGESGTGKSALLAYASEQAKEQSPDAKVIFRFVGATPGSSDIRSLLESLCHQISDVYSADESDIPAAYEELAKELPNRLALATPNKPLILFIDALDQLSETHNAKNLYWLPTKLPENVSLIVSTISTLPQGLQEECYRILKQKLPEDNLLELKPMSQEEGEKLLNVWLEVTHRTLQPKQREEILGNFKKNGNPLYLKLAFEEARRWKAYTPEKEIKLSPDISGIIQDLFKRLSSEKNHGEMMVSRSLGYIAAGKNGLSEDELIDVLSRDEEFFRDFLNRAFHIPPENRLPVIVWSRLYFDLEAYLIEISADGASLMTFYHPTTIGNEVKKKFLSGESKLARHQKLACYFGEQPLIIGKDEKRTPNLRKLSELPYQQTHAEMWDGIYETLTDFEFLEAKCTYVATTTSAKGKNVQNVYSGVYELLADYRLALDKFPS